MIQTSFISSRFKSQDLERIRRASAAAPGRQPGAAVEDACLNFHISPDQTDQLKRELDYSGNTSYTSPAAATIRVGSPKGATGEVSQFIYWRTSARITRMNKTPSYQERTNSKLILDEDHIARIADFNRCHNLPEMNWEQIQKAYNGSTRGAINSFSDKSRARLKFVATNCFPELISQFVLSYGETVSPNSGRTVKTQLDTWLKRVRRKFPGVAYLWVMEFQRRGSAHYHVFFSFPPSDEKREWLARAWVDIVAPDTDDPAREEERRKMHKVHNHTTNLSPWEMKRGSYLTKYLDKEQQKNVPEQFTSVGRFWGSSRNLVPAPDVLDSHEQILMIDSDTGEITEKGFSSRDLYRLLRRHHEASLRKCGVKRKSRLRSTHLAAINLPIGGVVIRQYIEWLRKNQDRNRIPFANQF